MSTLRLTLGCRNDDRTRALMGDDFCPDGLERNRKTPDTFLRYRHEQGLSNRRRSADERFVPESLEAIKI